MLWVDLFAFKKALAPIVISYHCCVKSMIGAWPREPLLSWRSKMWAWARAPGTGSICGGGAPVSDWAFMRSRGRMNCGLQSMNPSFPLTHLWPSQLKLLSILPTFHAEQSYLCPAEFFKIASSRRGVLWVGNYLLVFCSPQIHATFQ